MFARAIALLGSGLLLAGCGSSATTGSRDGSGHATSTSAPAASSTTAAQQDAVALHDFESTDVMLADRVHSAGLRGGIVRVAAADGTVLHEHTVGNVSGDTPLAVASSAKWITAATLLTFVDDGAIALDDDISRWLPEFAESNPPITARQLLDHTSGVRDHRCQGDGTSLAACVRVVASSPREFAAGSQFSYGNAPFLVVGRLIEVLGDADFATVVQRRITGPLGMDDTAWPGAPAAPNPAYGLTVTVDDYGRFLALVLHDGVVNTTRLLSSGAVRELVSDQVSDYDTSHDYSVGITGIPRYGLGCWVDVQAASGATEVVSGNGGGGFYPWVDYTTRTWGVVGVEDVRGAEVAVPASQAVEVEARTAVAGAS